MLPRLGDLGRRVGEFGCCVAADDWYAVGGLRKADEAAASLAPRGRLRMSAMGLDLSLTIERISARDGLTASVGSTVDRRGSCR